MDHMVLMWHQRAPKFAPISTFGDESSSIWLPKNVPFRNCLAFVGWSKKLKRSWWCPEKAQRSYLVMIFLDDSAKDGTSFYYCYVELQTTYAISTKRISLSVLEIIMFYLMFVFPLWWVRSFENYFEMQNNLTPKFFWFLKFWRIRISLFPRRIR